MRAALLLFAATLAGDPGVEAEAGRGADPETELGAGRLAGLPRRIEARREGPTPAPREAPDERVAGPEPRAPGLTPALTRRVHSPRGGPAPPPQRGMHLRTGLVLVPPALLGRFFRTHGNALCREEAGALARSHGANRVDGCNFFVEGGYRLKRRYFVVQASLGYMRLFVPQSIWLARGEPLEMADLTEVRLHVASAQVDLIGEFPLARRLDWRIGASLGGGLLLGGIYRTKLGSQTDACTLDGAIDLGRCRPYRAAEFDEAGRERPGYANCDAEGCSEADLIRAGRTRERLPNLVPVGRIFTGPRLRLRKEVGLSADVGVGVGVTVGIGLDARFGP